MSESDQSGAGRREVAYRIFASEFNDADYSFSESDEERAPSYVVTPTGARANRLFVVGVLTEIEQVSDDVLRARVVDPTGAFVLYAGQYQPDEQAFLERADPPAFVAVTGKARTFTPDDSDQVYTSIRPESISEVDAETRDRWTVQAAEHTTRRIGWMTQALSLGTDEGVREALVERGADDGLAHGIELALERYGTTPTYLDALGEMALDAARVVAGKRDEIERRTVAPDADSGQTVAELARTVAVDLEGPATAASTTAESSDGVSVGRTADTVEDGPESTDAVSDAIEPDSPDTTVEGTETDSESTEGSPEPTDSNEVESGSEPTASEPDITDSSGQSAPETTSEATTGAASEPSEAGTSEEATDELGDFEPDEFELEAQTRAEVEEEYGTEFQSGTEVDEPGEAGIETPEEVADEPPVSEPEGGSAGAAGSADAEAAKTEPETTDEAEKPDDLQAAVVELMGELDAGDGADREDLIAEMDARYGTEREAVESAIQDALMDGECYEPDDSLLKPI